ncbi:MAG: rod shape-determining protein RodA [Bacteroidales bacterium]|nr:rod shape-determining protein RodA [Bacteroidales bacterium]
MREREQKSFFANVDWMLIILYLLMVFAGWISIYAAVYDETHRSILSLDCDYGKQAIFILIAVVTAFVILLLDAKLFTSFAWVFYILAILALLSVFPFGSDIKGANAWIKIGQFSMQPGELFKWATALALAKYLSTHSFAPKKMDTLIVSILILLLPVGLIILQNDTGTALVYFALFIAMYREGMDGRLILFPIIAVVLFVLTLLLGEKITIIVISSVALLWWFFFSSHRWKSIRNTILTAAFCAGFVFVAHKAFTTFLSDYQQTRINVLLGIETDLKKAGYNVNQSLIAIGSGGVSGKGFLQGTQTKYNFVPEQNTDFIFCTVGEEYGFVGSFLVVGCFAFLILRIIRNAERQRSAFARIYGYCVASILAFHITVNIGMVLGLLPVIGIPLPFFSYGGSSLLGFTILLFIFIKQDANRLSLL